MEEWGGISYALEAFGAALPDGWVIRPILKVGEDLAEEASEYLAVHPEAGAGAGFLGHFRNDPRVELRYEDGARQVGTAFWRGSLPGPGTSSSRSCPGSTPST